MRTPTPQAVRWLSAGALLLATGAISLGGCTAVTARHSADAARMDSVVRAARQDEEALARTRLDPRAVGVLPLVVRSADSTYRNLGFGIAALIAADLTVSPQITVVERLRVDAVLRELDLAQRGQLDSATAPRAGRLIGAGRLVVGTIDIGADRSARLASQVTDVQRGTAGTAIDGSAALTQILDAQKQIVFRVFEQLGVTLTPSERRRLERRQTRSLAALLAYSAGVRAEQARDFSTAMQQFRQAARIDPGFAEAEVRGNTVQGVPTPVGGAITSLERATNLSAGFVNRAAPVVIGSPADAPVVARQQLVNITVTVRTP